MFAVEKGKGEDPNFIDTDRPLPVISSVVSSPMSTKEKWSQQVTEHSNALDLEENVFSQHNPKAIARSLKRSAEHSRRRRSSPYRSAMSMLTFYINRAGKDLDPTQRQVLEEAKDELRKAFGREPGAH
jgi:hypothetical protein